MEELLLHSLETIPLERIVKEEYRTYQIYTLMDRAIPYLQDGLKPGQRRILYTLFKNRQKGLMKVSSATGLVLTLHPHGPASVESAIVNMAQDYTFSNNYPLIEKKGYFGERMETSPAASRYIECKIGKIAELLLFDDLNQVEMVPNYDEKVLEPAAFFPKLPIMLLNGAEGIGTGFSSVIPSFNHKDLIDTIIKIVKENKTKKIKPYVHFFSTKIDIEKSGRMLFHMQFEEIGENIFITELPKGYDAKRTYKFLGKFLDTGYLKDFIDSSVNNDVKIELLFKRGQRPTLKEVQTKMKCTSSLVPNYTLISERGVKIFNSPEEIIEVFTAQRLLVVKRRYELLSVDYQKRIKQNNEIVKFIKGKHYIQATKSKDRKAFVDYLKSKKFTYFDYLADMAIYRMTKDEVAKRVLMIKDDTKSLKKFQKIAKSNALIKKKLIEELLELKEAMTAWQKEKESENQKLLKKLDKKEKKKKAPKKSKKI